MVRLELTRENAELLMHALRFAAEQAEQRVERGEADAGTGQVGQCRWLATYVEHKLRDAA